ncbi:hypothetical protein MSHOH_3684 [Methanosarcina horonobensis HB-1 = JCM 15518]|uniref:Uncharacterized protein n=1 Tax=Methanosarcina horonobensis HB-1 = JCM 15518 TaxID=1434110 RepID=A0A0E3SI79_9EURY|nr:hypothetical protein [Methanosarcina horonobensis]AKB80167.1 hypothetical protein MSHOH_3684 [Methanosarcina horonobensis HB-1 = JCM 15518]
MKNPQSNSIFSLSLYGNRKRGKDKRERAKNRELTQGDKKRKKSNGGSKANLHRSLQNYGDLKWRFTGKSSKFDLPINKSTYKYINLSH